MTIQLTNRSVVQPLGILEDVLVQVNELIFPVDFYVLDMEDKTSGKGSSLIMRRPFLMIARTKINVHDGTLSIEFGDTLVQFNIFEAMKHPTEDHSLFGIDLIDELVEEYFQLDSHSEDTDNFAEKTDLIGCLGSISKEEADYAESGEVYNLSDSVDSNNDIADLDFEVELLEILDQCSIEAEVQVAEIKKPFTVQADLHVQRHAETISAKEDQKQAKTESISDNQGENCILSESEFRAKQRAESNSNPARTVSIKRSRPQQPKVKIMSAHLVLSSTQVDQPDPKASHDNSSSSPPPMDYHCEQPPLGARRQHKNAIGWTLSDLPRINPSICMHRILMEEAAKPIRQQQRRMNLTILDVVKKEVIKLLAVGIIYPISDS
ncbi:hypothetical protein CR513_30613, partial [Mucuna pruriens]